MGSSRKTKVVRKIYADGRVEEVEEQMDLAQLQAFVGGYIEMVPTTIAHRALIVNEEGFLKRLPANEEATKLVRPGTLMGGGCLWGDVLLVRA